MADMNTNSAYSIDSIVSSIDKRVYSITHIHIYSYPTDTSLRLYPIHYVHY